MGSLKQTDVTAVLRTVGERTTDLCRHLIEEQIPGENIFTISEVPFSRAVQRTFEIGLDNRLPWTVAIDADVLLAKDAIQTLKILAQKYGETLFKFNSKMQDKFFRPTRYGGLHLYQTRHLQQALSLFDEVEYIRPETHLAEVMQARCNCQIVLYENYIAGLHDYEQYYRDIYRKAFVFAHKHPQGTLHHFLRYWGENTKYDADYFVAFAGLSEGLAHSGEIEININKLPQQYSENRLCVGFKEKEALTEFPWQTGEDIKRDIQLIELRRGQPSLVRFAKHQGVLKGGAATIGHYIATLGNKLYRWGS